MFDVNAQHVQVYVRIKPTDNFAAKNIKLSSNNKSLIIHGNQPENADETINNQVADWEFRYSMFEIIHLFISISENGITPSNEATV